MIKRQSITILLTLVSLFSFSQHSLRWYPFKEKGEKAINFTSKDSTLYFSPSISFEAFTKEKYTGEYQIGIIPGVGYGLKYNPFKWKSDYLVGIDVFAQSSLSKNKEDSDYFNIRIIPTISILNWIHVGYGTVWKIGLKGDDNINTSVFTIGISKSL